MKCSEMFGCNLIFIELQFQFGVFAARHPSLPMKNVYIANGRRTFTLGNNNNCLPTSDVSRILVNFRYLHAPSPCTINKQRIFVFFFNGTRNGISRCMTIFKKTPESQVRSPNILQIAALLRFKNQSHRVTFISTTIIIESIHRDNTAINSIDEFKMGISWCYDRNITLINEINVSAAIRIASL